ncbi:MAG TPA: hypothetical protein VF834_03670, partial [Streptosporangiaceae bacterium]
MTSTEHPAQAPDRTRTAPPGWYGDPWQRFAQRWWTGLGWSGYVRQGRAHYLDPLPEEFGHLQYLEGFLDRARTDQVLSPDTYRILIGQVASREAELAAGVPGAIAPAGAGASAAPAMPTVPATPTVPETPTAPAMPTVPATPGVPAKPMAPVPAAASAMPPKVASPATPPQPKEPGPARRRARAMRSAISSDLAVHGLAYLGVLLLFTGLFGVVAFSFSSVRVEFRPVAEVVVPAAVLASGWLLARRKLTVPARAVVLLGGLLLLVAAVALFLDGASVPPDPAGTALVAALTAAPVTLAAVYALWA